MKKLGALLLIFLGLAAFVYFYEIEGQKTREESKTLEDSLLRSEQEDIVSLELSRFNQKDLVLIREGEEWAMREPIKAMASKASVEGLLRSLEEAKRDRIFTAEKDEVKVYGLENPRMVLKIDSGEQEQTLLVGREDYTGTKIYVQLAGIDQVFLTSNQIYSSADKDLKEWRSKKIIFFESNKTQAIEINSPKGQIRLMRQKDWFLEDPISERADQTTVSNLLSALQYGEVQDFISDKPKGLRKYGLNKPRVKIRLRHEGEDRWSELQVGKEIDGNYHAINSDRVSVFTVQEDLREKLIQDVWAFRDKDVINVSQEEIDLLVMRREDGEIVLRRKDYKWIIEEPESQKDQEAIGYKFWYPMDDIKYESIKESSEIGQSIAEADVEVIVTRKNGEKSTFTFMQRDNSYIAIQQDSGRKGTISRESFEKLKFKIEDIVSASDG